MVGAFLEMTRPFSMVLTSPSALPVVTATIASSRVLKRRILAFGRYCWVIRSWAEPRSTAKVNFGSLSSVQVLPVSSSLAETSTKLL
ncbi:hypothetical protein D3C72_2029540 [compost metagenome]